MAEHWSQQRGRLDRALARARQTEREASQALKEARDEVARCQSHLERMKRPPDSITVTDHAVLRYLERVHEVDLDQVRGLILPTKVKEQILKLGDGEYPVEGGFKIRVKRGRVVTVIAKGAPK